MSGTSARARRELTIAVLGCLAGAGTALGAANQEWAERVTRRSPPLSPIQETFSGGELAPWLPAVALVALAAAVALIATRSWGRTVVAVTALLCGVGILAGAVSGLVTGAAAGRTGLDAGLWPVVCGLGGLVVAGVGIFAVRRGHSWPAMGARYQRPASVTEPAPQPAVDDSSQFWDALDAGSDPTTHTDDTGRSPADPTR